MMRRFLLIGRRVGRRVSVEYSMGGEQRRAYPPGERRPGADGGIRARGAETRPGSEPRGTRLRPGFARSVKTGEFCWSSNQDKRCWQAHDQVRCKTPSAGSFFKGGKPPQNSSVLTGCHYDARRSLGERRRGARSSLRERGQTALVSPCSLASAVLRRLRPSAACPDAFLRRKTS